MDSLPKYLPPLPENRPRRPRRRTGAELRSPTSRNLSEDLDQHHSEEKDVHSSEVHTADRAAERYATLVQQLAEEMDHKWGWKGAVAKRLGVSPAYISMIVNGQRSGIGIDSIEKAIKRLGIDRSYFYGAHRGTPSYREFEKPRVGDAVRSGLLYPSLAKVLGSTEISEEDREWITTVRFEHGDPGEFMFEMMLLARKRGLTQASVARDARVNEEETERAKARGGRILEPGSDEEE